MKRFLILSLILSTLLALPGISSAKLNVVATTPDIAAIAQTVGGAEVEVTTLVRPTEDPHFIEPKPSFVVRLSRADVLIEGGAELEAGWLPALLQRAGNRRLMPGAPGRIMANAGIEMLEVPTTLDRSKGDVHAAGNPHFLIDPANAMIFARRLGEAFAQLDPPSADVYRGNAAKFVSALEPKIIEWRKALESHKGQTIVGYHNSWPYFARRFDLKIDLFLEPKPGLPPSPGHLAHVIERMKQENARVIMVDRYFDRRTAESVAKRTGAKVVEVSHYPGGIKGTENNYIALLDYLVKTLGEAFVSTR
jgi:zinc/manganese transport system substrate-binding protein